MSNKINCSECILKQKEIYKLREENQRLKAKLKYQERKNNEGFFGSSTPSSQLPVKPNTTKKRTKAGPKKATKETGEKLSLKKKPI